MKKCSECGSNNLFWHCQSGWGSATCNECKSPLYFERKQERKLTESEKLFLAYYDGFAAGYDHKANRNIHDATELVGECWSDSKTKKQLD